MACRIEKVIGFLAFLGIFPFSSPLEADILIEPAAIVFDGPQAAHSLLVSSISSSGERTDLGRDCSYRSLTPDIVSVTADGLVESISDGKGRIEIEVRGRKHIIDVTVRRSKEPRSYHFENDILPLLSKYGCNSSKCHGKAEGQKGFKLSVFSFDPGADYDAIARDSRRRRVNPASPRNSLLLLKATGQTAHEGGRRFDLKSGAFQTLLGWIEAGMPKGNASAPRVERIRIAPRRARLGLESEQQLQVIARYSDGREVDVAPLSVFQSNNDGLATVDGAGINLPVKIPLLQPAHVIGVGSTVVTAPKDVNKISITLQFAKEAGPFNAPLIIRATASEDNGDLIVGETNIEAVWLDETGDQAEAD